MPESELSIFSSGVVEFRWGEPHFFEEGESTVSVTFDRIVEMLGNCMEPRHNKPGYLCLWFQQDGTTANIATAFMEVLSVEIL